MFKPLKHVFEKFNYVSFNYVGNSNMFQLFPNIDGQGNRASRVL